MKTRHRFGSSIGVVWELFVAHISFLWHWKNFVLCLRYPFWKARNPWTGHFGGYSYTWYEFIPDGWKKAFGKELSRDLKAALKAARKRIWKEGHHTRIKTKDMIIWVGIKEKYGELRLDATAVTEVMDVLEKYEILSSCYCISCGKPARYVTRKWIEYLCDDCHTKYLKGSLHYTDEEVHRAKETDRLKTTDIPRFLTVDRGGTGSTPHIGDDIDFTKAWGLENKGAE